MNFRPLDILYLSTRGRVRKGDWTLVQLDGGLFYKHYEMSLSFANLKSYYDVMIESLVTWTV